MRAAVLNQIPGTLDIQEVRTTDVEAHEVLVRVAAAGLCHSDLHFMEGKWVFPVPAVLGHEAAGVVEAVGDQVAGIKPGDHVITCLSVYCGSCEDCLTGNPARCRNQAALRRPPEGRQRLEDAGGRPIAQFADLSAFAEQMLVHERALIKIRPDMPLDRAALIGCAVTTGIGAVFHTAKVEPGSTVAVIGCGGVGLNTVQGARIAGAGRIIAVDTNPRKLEAATEFGATDCVAADGDAVAEVRDLSGGGVHYSFEAVGTKATAEQAFAMIRPGGTATIIGMVPLDQTVELPAAAFMQEKRLQGTSMGSNRFPIDIPRYIDLYLAGRLKLDELVSRRIGLSEVNEGYEALKAGETLRSVIVFD